MLYLLYQSKASLKYISSGKFVSDSSFIHSRRKLDTFVLLIGCKGTLYISQNNVNYELKPDTFVLLLPGYEHFGYQPSDAMLSYYWCHFTLDEQVYKLLSYHEMNQYTCIMDNELIKDDALNTYILPECGSILSSDRTRVFFRQLLDLSNTHCYSAYMCDYALSLLAMEITETFLSDNKARNKELTKTHCTIPEIMEWIRINYDKRLTVNQVAQTFNYNPDYLSNTFKKVTGVSLSKYINKMKISIAKKLLFNSGLSIREIAYKSGFDDEKYFMKLFKQLEDVTPSQYRNAFSRTHLNNK